MGAADRGRLAGLPMLDGLRAVAAGGVLLTHVAFQTGAVGRGAGGALLGRFDAGVAVFFVLSGFLLYRPYTVALHAGRPAPGLRRYALRRAARILPAYWAALVVVALTTSPAPRGRVLTHIWLGQTYVGQLFPSYTQTWSLCAEVAFYAVLPFLALLVWAAVRRWGAAAEWWTLLGLALGGYAYVGVARGFGFADRSLLWLPGHLDWFAVGMGLAALWARIDDLPDGLVVRVVGLLARWPGTSWALAGVLLWLWSTPVAGPLTLDPIPGLAALVKEAGYAVISALLMIPCVFGDPARGGLGAALAHPVSRYLGRISYGIFLWHLLVLRGLYSVAGWQPFTGRLFTVAVLTIAGSVAVAALSWVLVEKPALRAAAGVGARSSRKVAAPAAR
jgi:peptidoglycan/LPS O-acetylase OafA/YrhL